MTASSTSLPGRPVLLSGSDPSAPAIRTTALVAGEQTGSLTFAKSSTVGVDAAASFGAVGINSSTTKLSLDVNLQTGRNYNFTFWFTSGGPKVTLIDSSGKRIAVNMAKGFSVAKAGSYKLVFEAGYSLKTAGFDNLNLRATSVLPKTSGDKRVDALLNGGTSAWWHPFDAAAVKDIAKVSPKANGLAAGSSATTLTYSFLSTQPTGQGMTNFQEMTDAQKDAVRRAFDYYGKIINVAFTEVAGDGTGNINFGTNDQAASAGYATLPNVSGIKDKAYLFLANNQATNDDQGVQEGNYGWQTILHEIGHTLGLKHPGNYNAGGGGTPGPYLPKGEDNHEFSIMAYSDNNATRGAHPTTAMLYDVEALQYLYGANKNASTAQNGAFAFTPGAAHLQTLWSASGTDTIDLSGLTHASRVNLNAGTFSSIDIVGAASSTFYSGNGNVAIAYGAQINQVALSSATGVADSVTLNAAFGTGSFDTLTSFDTGVDRIALSKSIFGQLKAANIEFGTAATKTTSKIIVNQSTGEIFYDADGSKTRSTAKKIAQFTTIPGGASLTAANFSFVA